jgi:hypothetical protein
MRAVLIIGYHGLPILFYALAARWFWKIAHVRGSYPVWCRAWYCLLLSTGALSVTRIFNIVDALGQHPGDWLITYQSAWVILAAALVALGAYWCWQVFCDGWGTMGE